MINFLLISASHGDMAIVRETPRTMSFHSHSMLKNHCKILKLLKNIRKAAYNARRQGRQKVILLIPKEKFQEDLFCGFDSYRDRSSGSPY